MIIAIGCDAAGFELKKEIIAHLQNCGHEYKDFGTFNQEPCDYPQFALAVCESLTKRDCDFGILICGTGIGMSIMANRMPGIRCALCSDVFSAKSTRQHNDANILALGARVIGTGLAIEIVNAFLNEKFSNEERHSRRIAMLDGKNK
ncbi:MAG: ribose 5-phosphate isomerase B [Defluviitaleaceae bacterium]|nr:ribose 5-phosphate isomerase B [Defluviitaleaceae bacterium]